MIDNSWSILLQIKFSFTKRLNNTKAIIKNAINTCGRKSKQLRKYKYTKNGKFSVKIKKTSKYKEGRYILTKNKILRSSNKMQKSRF